MCYKKSLFWFGILTPRYHSSSLWLGCSAHHPRNTQTCDAHGMRPSLHWHSEAKCTVSATKYSVAGGHSFKNPTGQDTHNSESSWRNMAEWIMIFQACSMPKIKNNWPMYPMYSDVEDLHHTISWRLMTSGSSKLSPAQGNLLIFRSFLSRPNFVHLDQKGLRFAFMFFLCQKFHFWQFSKEPLRQQTLRFWHTVLGWCWMTSTSSGQECIEMFSYKSARRVHFRSECVTREFQTRPKRCSDWDEWPQTCCCTQILVLFWCWLDGHGARVVDSTSVHHRLLSLPLLFRYLAFDQVGQAKAVQVSRGFQA